MKFKHGTRRRALEYEKEWVKTWKDNKTFEKSVENRSKDNGYVFYDGPPFITGDPHHGTLLSSIVKDAVPRYWTMKGKRVERVWGWDTHGLPAENFVEKQLNITDRRQIITSDDAEAPLDKDGNPLSTISLEAYTTKARESMVASAATWEDIIDRIGRWVEFKGAYKTMDKDFMESVWWAFKTLYEKGKIYEGEKVLMYDTKFATPVSKNEVTMDNDAYQTVTDPSLYAKFKLKDEIKPNNPLSLNKDSKVLFVCCENIGRSQMAKAVYNKLTGTSNANGAATGFGKEFREGTIADLEKKKSGKLGEAYQSTAKIAIQEKIGVDISNAPRIKLSPEMIADYDLIVNIAEKWQTPDWLHGDNVIWWDVKDPGMIEDYEGRMAASREALSDIEKRVQELYDGKIIDDNINSSYVLAWTTTPWTLPANLMLAVNPELTYVEVLVDNGATLGAGNFAVKSINNPVVKKAHDVLAKFEGIEYGHVDKDGYVHRQSDADYDEQKFEDYRLQGAEQVAKNQTGVCWDQTEYTRYLLEQDGISTKTYAIVYYDYDNDSYYNHTIAVFESEGSYYWLEHSMADIAGIYEFSSLDSLISSLKSEFLAHNKNVIPADYQESRLRLWEYDVLRPDSSPEEVFGHWERAVNLDNLLTSDEKLILTKGAIERVLQDDKHKPLKYKIVREFPGSELVGESYEPLATGSTWPQSDAIHKIYAADFVSHESGSGIVHVAPAYGEDDFELAKSHGVEAFHVIDDNGYYTDTNYKGLEVWENNKFIAKDLKEKGIVWKIDYIRHEYPFNPRSKQRIMYRAIPSWFFDVQDSKPLMLEENQKINWFPEHLKNGRFAKNIEQAPDWNLSRDRFWATAMPVWKGDKGTVKVVGSYAELKKLSGVELEDYHRPWVDDIVFDIDGEHFTRIDKVLDCWFESGSMPFAQFHYPFENKEKFEANFPGDFIVEYIGQVRAWFYYVHVVNTSLFGSEGFKNVIVTGNAMGSDGRKLSKSLGNFTDPNEVMDKFSADSLRFLLLSSPLLNGEDFTLLDKDVGDVARKLSMVWNMYDFFTMYAEVDEWEYDNQKPMLKLDELTNPLDIWIISRLHQLNEEVTRFMDEYNIPDAMSGILPFLDDASNWFVRRSRRRFWKSEDDGDKNDAYRTLHYVLMKLSVILAPFTPFLAEELYQKLGGGEESVHLLDWPTNYAVDEVVLDEMNAVRDYVNQGLSLRAKAGLKVRQPLASVTVPSLGTQVDFESILLEELNVKSVLVGSEVSIDENITPELKREGLMREVIRFVQSARKKAGLNVDDRIELSLQTSDLELRQAIDEHEVTIATETLASIVPNLADAYEESVDVEKTMKLKIALKK